MMGGLDGGRRLMEGETSKPKNLGATLRRFGQYFRHYWHGALIALVLIVGAAWTQVRSPEIIGQAVDCYFAPRAAMEFAGVSVPASNCWFDPTMQAAIDSNTIDQVSNEAKLAGVGSLVLILVALFVAGAVFNCLAFYFMGRTGHLVLRKMRQDLFRHMQKLSLGYYAENEVGNIMSRVTSDTDTIQQVFSFGLLSVFSGFLLMIWIVVTMLQTNLPYGLISLAVVPVMFVATVYLSNQARKAFRRSRQEMGSVNADLQESIAGVREVQAFNREEENIENFRRTNAANRDANVRAAAFTSALNPVLEA